MWSHRMKTSDCQQGATAPPHAAFILPHQDKIDLQHLRFSTSLLPQQRLCEPNLSPWRRQACASILDRSDAFRVPDLSAKLTVILLPVTARSFLISRGDTASCDSTIGAGKAQLISTGATAVRCCLTANQRRHE